LGDGKLLLSAVICFVVFIALSGAVYLVNDLLDVVEDRRHPLKRLRPIAAEEFPVYAARALAIALAVAALGLSFALSPAVSVVVGSYLAVNLLYSAWLKRVPFLDVLCIALGFVLRVVAGGFAIGVELSTWLFICTFLLAVFLGLGKRRHELALAGNNGAKNHTRAVLARYTTHQLNIALDIAAVLTVSAYTLYTVAEDTIQKFGTHRLAVTTPFIVFGLLRYLRLIERREDDSPTEQILKDWPFLTTVVLWVAAIVVLLYGPPGFRA
jgi:4-hydroxybenzoate polyprenyltransferase